METKVKGTGIHCLGSGRWTVAPGAHVAITFLRHYYAGRGVISKILCRDPMLVEVNVIEVCHDLEVELPNQSGICEGPLNARDVTLYGRPSISDRMLFHSGSTERYSAGRRLQDLRM